MSKPVYPTYSSMKPVCFVQAYDTSMQGSNLSKKYPGRKSSTYLFECYNLVEKLVALKQVRASKRFVRISFPKKPVVYKSRQAPEYSIGSKLIRVYSLDRFLNYPEMYEVNSDLCEVSLTLDDCMDLGTESARVRLLDYAGFWAECTANLPSNFIRNSVTLCSVFQDSEWASIKLLRKAALELNQQLYNVYLSLGDRVACGKLLRELERPLVRKVSLKELNNYV